MGLNNLIVQKTMKSQAKKIADLAAKTYPVVKAQNPKATESEIFVIMLCKDLSELSKMPAPLRTKVTECCQSIQGLSYFIAIDQGALKGFMNFRCLQFTQYMDRELELRGFQSQPLSIKKRVLGALDLLVDGWENWV